MTVYTLYYVHACMVSYNICVVMQCQRVDMLVVHICPTKRDVVAISQNADKNLSS